MRSPFRVLRHQAQLELAQATADEAAAEAVAAEELGFSDFRKFSDESAVDRVYNQMCGMHKTETIKARHAGLLRSTGER